MPENTNSNRKAQVSHPENQTSSTPYLVEILLIDLNLNIDKKPALHYFIRAGFIL